MPNERISIGAITRTDVLKDLMEPVRQRSRAAQVIQTKFEELGGAPGSPVPTSSPDGLEVENGGFYRAFQDGRIYTQSVPERAIPLGRGGLNRLTVLRQTAFWVHGAILGKYLEMGGPGGWIGWPQSDETATAAGPGRFSRFQKASIYWGPTTGAHVVYGAIRDKWNNLGAEGGFGLPVSDEQDIPGQPGARQSRFEGGLITWSPWAGARVTRLFGVSPEASRGNIRIQTQGSGGQAVPGPQVNRHLIISAAMDLTDDEFWADDEHGHVETRDERWLDNWDSQAVLQLVGKAGGELRVELSATAAVRPDGSVRVNMDATLFEGTSEESTDVDGRRSTMQIVPPGQIVQIPLRINNDDEGGDFADIKLIISNSDT